MAMSGLIGGFVFVRSIYPTFFLCNFHWHTVYVEFVCLFLFPLFPFVSLVFWICIVQLVTW